MRCGLQAERAVVDLGDAVQPLAVGGVAHAAVAMFFKRCSAHPRVEHGALGSEQCGMQRGRAGPDKAATERGRRCIVRAEPQPSEQQRFGRHSRRARRRRDAHATRPSGSRGATCAGMQTNDSVGRFMAAILYRPTRARPRRRCGSLRPATGRPGSRRGPLRGPRRPELSSGRDAAGVLGSSLTRPGTPHAPSGRAAAASHRRSS